MSDLPLQDHSQALIHGSRTHAATYQQHTSQINSMYEHSFTHINPIVALGHTIVELSSSTGVVQCFPVVTHAL